MFQGLNPLEIGSICNKKRAKEKGMTLSLNPLEIGSICNKIDLSKPEVYIVSIPLKSGLFVMNIF